MGRGQGDNRINGASTRASANARQRLTVALQAEQKRDSLLKPQAFTDKTVTLIDDGKQWKIVVYDQEKGNIERFVLANHEALLSDVQNKYQEWLEEQNLAAV